MYNGIGLTTPRGSGTNGHVQRNWAFVRPGKKDTANYRSEEDVKKLDASLNRPPNKDILDHDRKRKIEVKCLEFEEILERQSLSPDEIKTKVDSYRKKLMEKGKSDIAKDEYGRITVRDSHQIAEAQQEKNAKLREAFNISEYFVEGSSFDSDRKAKEDLAKNLALQKELDAQREETAAAPAKEKESSKRYSLDRTPSMDHDVSSAGVCGGIADSEAKFKKKKKKSRESSASPERKRDRKKKSKKRKKESKPKKSKKLRKRKVTESDSAENDKESVDEDSQSEIEADIKKNRKKSKKDKKKRKSKKRERFSSSEKSRSTSLESRKNQNFQGKKSNFVFRSRSKEKSYKPRESQRNRYESSQYSRTGRSRSRKDRSKLHSKSNKDKNLNNRQSSSHTERNGDLRYSIRSNDYSSRERSDSNKDRENRISQSYQKINREISNERAKNLKRKRYDEYSLKKSTNVEKRQRYSRSHSPSLTKQSRDEKYDTNATEIQSNSSRASSRTPRRNSLDIKSKLKKSRSRSSSGKRNFRKKSHTPPLQMSTNVESKKYNTNEFDTQKKIDINMTTHFMYTKSGSPKSRSRNTSTSSSITSSTDTRTSKPRTPPPKKDYLEKPLITENKESQNRIEERKSLSPIRTPTPTNEKSRKNIRSTSISKEKQEHKMFSSRTPPPTKVEKKALSPRSSRDSSELSYSPAGRNPEHYSDILENNKHKTEKSKFGNKDEERRDHAKSLKQSEDCEWDRKERGSKNDRNLIKPVVRLHSQSDEDSDTIERNTENILDEFQEFKRERELKDLKMLEQLKTGIAAKAKEKIKTIEKMAATTSAISTSYNDGEVSDKSYKRAIRNSLNDFLAANNVAPAVVATCSSTVYNSTQNSPPGAIYPQTLEEVKREQKSVLQLTEISNSTEIKNKNSNKDSETQVNCKKFANDHALPVSPTESPLRNNANSISKERDRKRERDFRERERETTNFNKDRYLERRQRSSPNFYNSGTIGGANMTGGRRNINNSSMLNVNHRPQRLNLMCNSGGVGAHHHSHSHVHPHYHHPNHKIINNYLSSGSSSSSIYITNSSSTNPHTLICNHANNSTNISFNRPSRINNTPLITATQFNNQMLSKQSNSILVNRRDHRTALNLGLSGTPCTNFSNSNLLLTKANNNQHHLQAAAVGHIVGGGHHHQHHHHHHHHHHGQNSSISSSGNNPATQITDRILMAASIAAAQRHSLGVHPAASSAAVVAAANNLNFLQQQNKTKLVIKPFKINDSQPLVAALADSSLVDAIVSKVSTATVAAAESAARRSRSRSRRSRSRNRHVEKTSSGGRVGERDVNRRRSASQSRSSRSSTSSRSRSRSHSHRTSRSRSSESSSSSHTSSRSSSSGSFGSSRSGTRSPSIPRRRGSPSFLDRRRITSRYSSSRYRRH